DHINHFSEPALRTMLARAGFAALDVDAESHDAAFIVVARKLDQSAAVKPDSATVHALAPRATEMAQSQSGVYGTVPANGPAANGSRRHTVASH
ncbi:MAG: hypothetical protein ABIS45_07995, partial [Burkholderiales bacterium]